MSLPFDIDLDDAAPVVGSALPPISAKREPVVLRDYQERATDAAVEAIQSRKNYVHVLPTGSGKSLVIAAIAERLPDANVLVLQPTREILVQNITRFRSFGHGDAEIFSASLARKRRSRVTFGTIGSVIKRLNLFAETDIVVVDEAHLVNSYAGQYKDLIEALGVPVVGLTATPYRMKARGPGSSFPTVEARFLHRVKPRIFQNVGYVVQTSDLHERGYLSKIEYREPCESYDTSKIELNSTGLNFDPDSTAAYHRMQRIPERTADVIREVLSRGRRHVLCFAQSIAESQGIANALGAIEVAHVDGTTPARERERIIARFLSGALRVVCNVGVLTTGFDFPALDTVILSRPTMSLPLYYQMVGRGVRALEGKENLVVVDLCANVRRFGEVERWRIVSDDGYKWRVMCGEKPLTGVNYLTGVDLERPPSESEKIPFGKHQGKAVSEVETGYLEWAVQTFDPNSRWRKIFARELSKRRGNDGE